MNIFYVDEDPTKAAQALVDKHVVKMILESAQMLSTAHRVLDGHQHPGKTKAGRKTTWYLFTDGRENIVYKATHINHPSSKWVRESVENYNWLVDHFFALLDEYTFRYEKDHKCRGELSWQLSCPPKALQVWDRTPIVCAMDEKYIISENPVENYRNYYRLAKKDLHKWTKRNQPNWI